MIQKTLLFLSCHVARVAARENGASYPLSISPDYRDTLESVDGITQECVDGTIALTLDTDVQDALSPFLVDFVSSLNPFDEDFACEAGDFILFEPTIVTCNFDFSALEDEHQAAKDACVASGGKIFLFNLDSSFLIPLVVDASVVVVEFPLCVDPVCDIDAMLKAEEEVARKEMNDDFALVNTKTFELTASCVQDDNNKFFLKRKEKCNDNGVCRKKVVQQTCRKLDKRNNRGKTKTCANPRSTKKIRSAREECPKTCCGISLAV